MFFDILTFIKTVVVKFGNTASIVLLATITVIYIIIDYKAHKAINKVIDTKDKTTTDLIKSEMNKINLTITSLVDKFNNVDKTLSKYIFKFESTDDDRRMDMLRTILKYVNLDFEAIEHYIITITSTDDARDRIKAEGKGTIELTNEISDYLISNVIGTARTQLGKMGWNINISDTLETCNHIVFPMLREALLDIIEVYLTGNGRRSTMLPKMIKTNIALIKEKYAKQLELLLSEI